MNSSTQQTKYNVPIGRKVALSIVFVSMVSGLAMSTAFADNDRGQDQRDRRDNHSQRDRHNNWENRGYRAEPRRHYDNYAQPVYAPAPVYYEPRRSPGVSLFFPIDIR